MKIDVQTTGHRIEIPSSGSTPGTGSVVEFQGIVRAEENGSRISALVYEIYEPMAGKVIRRLLEELGMSFPCQDVLVIHRFGIVPVGEAAIYIRILSRHRQEGFRLLDEFMNRLKLEVPIWKVRAVA